MYYFLPIKTGAYYNFFESRRIMLRIFIPRKHTSYSEPRSDICLNRSSEDFLSSSGNSDDKIYPTKHPDACEHLIRKHVGTYSTLRTETIRSYDKPVTPVGD